MPYLWSTAFTLFCGGKKPDAVYHAGVKIWPSPAQQTADFYTLNQNFWGLAPSDGSGTDRVAASGGTVDVKMATLLDLRADPTIGNASMSTVLVWHGGDYAPMLATGDAWWDGTTWQEGRSP